MIELEVGMPVLVNGIKAEIVEIGWRDERGNYKSVKIEYENGSTRWVPVEKLEFINEKIPRITSIRPREIYYERRHAGRMFPTGSGGRIIERSHPAYNSEIIVIGGHEERSPGRKPVTYYDVEVLEGSRKGETFRMLGSKEKLWLEEPLKSEDSSISEELSQEIIEEQEFKEPPESLPFEEVPSEQYPLFRIHEYDLPKGYEKILDEIFGQKRDYSRPFPTARQLAIKLGLTTKTAKFYLDTIKKEFRDRGILPETECMLREEDTDYLSKENIEEEDIPSEEYLEFWGIEDEEEKE